MRGKHFFSKLVCVHQHVCVPMQIHAIHYADIHKQTIVISQQVNLLNLWKGVVKIDAFWWLSHILIEFKACKLLEKNIFKCYWICGQCDGVTGYFSTCSTSVPCGCWSTSQLLHFWSSSLLRTWERSGGWQKTLDPGTYIRDSEETPGCWLQTSSTLTHVAIWQDNQQMKGSLSLSLIFQICLSTKNKPFC